MDYKQRGFYVGLIFGILLLFLLPFWAGILGNIGFFNSINVEGGGGILFLLIFVVVISLFGRVIGWIIGKRKSKKQRKWV